MPLSIAAATVMTRLHHQPHGNPLSTSTRSISSSTTRRSSNGRRQCRVCCLITDPASFQVGRLIGTYGFMNITRYCKSSMTITRSLYNNIKTSLCWIVSSSVVSYSNPTSTIDYSDLGQLRTQDVGEGTVNIRSLVLFFILRSDLLC